MLNDERLASALGFRVDKVFSESQNSCTQQPPRTTSTRDLVVLETEDSAPIRHHFRAKKSSGPVTGSLVYIIVLILLSASIFGLEVYRIREVGDLTERMQLVRSDLNLLRNEIMFRFADPNSEKEIVKLLNHRSGKIEPRPEYEKRSEK